MSERTHCVTTKCQTSPEGPQPAQSRKVLCIECQGDISKRLRAIAGDWAAAHRSLHPSGSGGDEPVTGSRTQPMPVDIDVAEILRRVRSNVWFVARLVYDERELDAVDAGDQSTPALCRWLQGHVDWLAGHKDADVIQGICDDLDADAKSVAWATRPLRARRVSIAGLRCTEHGTDDMGQRVECDGKLYALVGVRDGLPDLRCSADKDHVIDPATWTSKGFNRTMSQRGALNLRAAIVGG